MVNQARRLSKRHKYLVNANILRILNGCILILIIMVCVLPFINILAKSFSAKTYVLSNSVAFWPRGFELQSYEKVIGNARFLNSFFLSIVITVVGTLLSTSLTTLTAYALSRRTLICKRILMFLYIFTMLFSGGIIPTYLIMKDVGLLNSVWVLILPNVVLPFNMIVLRNYFMTIPGSIEESAEIDGAYHTRIIISIILPLAMPAVATILLFYAVGYWNSYFDALMYISTRKLTVLQVYLREIILSADINSIDMDQTMDVAQDSVRGAAVVASAMPILLLYPWLQKYFVKGALIGSVKQ